MKFTITKDAFQDVLATVRSVVPSRPSFPILSNVLVTTADDSVYVSASDFDTTVFVRVPAEIAEAGALAVPARKLTELVATFPSGSIKIEVRSKQMRIQCGKGSFTLNGMDADEFPRKPVVSFDQAISLPASRISELSAHVSFAASTESARPILNGTLWELLPGTMRMVATDGHRLALMETAIDSAVASEARLIVSRKVLQEIDRFFRNDDTVQVAFADNYLAFRSNTVEVYTRLIEGPYPTYNAVIPRECDKIALIDVAMLKSALRRMSVLASDQTHRVRFEFTENTLALSAETPDLGGGQDSLPIKYDGAAPFAIGFNANYLLEILDRIKTEQVQMGMIGPERAVKLVPINDDGQPVANQLALCMPLRLFD